MQIFTYTLALTLLDLYSLLNGSQHIEAIGNHNDLEQKYVGRFKSRNISTTSQTSLTRRKKRQKQTMAKAISKELDSIFSLVLCLLFN